MNILFYGFRHGHIFPLFEQAKAHPDFTILGAIEENDEARTRAQERLQYPIEADGYLKWLENPEVDVVAIAGAYGNRGEAIRQALLHGKHIISDKPLCTELSQLKEIARFAREKNLKVGCMLDLRYGPSSLRAKQILESGEMGAIKNITFTGEHYIDYANRPSWYFEPGMHGGTFNDIAIHGLDLIHFMTGHRLEKVYCARAWNAFATRHPDFKDSASFIAETDKGAGLTADVSYCAPSQAVTMPTYWNFKFWCENGLVQFSYNDPNVHVFRNGGASEGEDLPGIAPEETVLDTLRNEIVQDTNTFTESVLLASQMALNLQKEAI